MKFAVFDHLDRSGPDLGRQYEDRLRLTEIYEWAGFHAYHVAEHHGTPLGSAPSPGLFLAAVAQRTTRLRFGPLAYPLGLYHPLRLIEEICMLDVMSGGRLELGVGRGASPYEAAFFGIEPTTAQERFDETLEIVLKGLGAPRLDHAGKFFTLIDIPLVMQPVQRPHPPLWHVTRSLDSADRLAGLGCNVALAMPTRDAGRFTRRYRAAWAALGRAPADMPFVGNTRNVVVLDSDGDAVSAARRAFHVWYEFDDPPVAGQRRRAAAADLPVGLRRDRRPGLRRGRLGRPGAQPHARRPSMTGINYGYAASPTAISRSRKWRARCACSRAR